jgi:hypothetical protein
MKSNLLQRGPEFALPRRGYRRVRRRRGSAEGARTSSSVCGTNFANADRMFDCPERLRLTRKPGHPTALPPTTASTGRDRQLVAQGITKQTPPKYPNICPKWTDRRPCERGTPEPSKTPMLGQWSCAARPSTGPCFLRSDCEESIAVDPYCGGIASLSTRNGATLKGDFVIVSNIRARACERQLDSARRAAPRRSISFPIEDRGLPGRRCR